MEWLTKSHPGNAEVSPADVKLCDLCGTLNYKANSECFTCGWKGSFCRDAAALEIAWLRLSTEFESVRLEHVMARRTAVLGHFGQARQETRWQRYLAWWKSLFRGRAPRLPQKEKPQHQAPAARPNLLDR